MAANTAQGPSTTIVPFNDRAKLPDCAKACGPLYDANGACVPPAIPQGKVAGYFQCFCLDSRAAPFSTGTSGVCDQACTADPNGLQSIAAWYRDVCQVRQVNTASTATPTSAPGAANNANSANSGGGGSWLSGHWRWVVMLVILVVGIAGIWIGACIWRRRYLRRKDRQSFLGQKHSGSASNPTWGPTVTGSDSSTPMTKANNSRDPESAFTAEKPSKNKKKWRVRERT